MALSESCSRSPPTGLSRKSSIPRRSSHPLSISSNNSQNHHQNSSSNSNSNLNSNLSQNHDQSPRRHHHHPGGLTTSSHLTIKNNNNDDEFLSHYLKSPDMRTTLNDHSLYFKSIDKQRKLGPLDIYQQYLNQNTQKKYHLYFQKQNKKDIIYQQYVKEISPGISPRTETLNRRQGDVETKAPPGEPKKSKYTREDTSITEPIITRRLTSEFMDCPIDFLIILISRMLKSLITLNDKSVPTSISNPPAASVSTAQQPTNNLLTRYHSRTPPAISTFTYLTRLTKFNNFNPTILLTTIYYIDLLSHQYQPFFTLNSWTVHRFLLVATMIAQKSLEDFFYTNDHYAKVGGVALSELNCLELDFLSRVDWRCVPGKQEIDPSSGVLKNKINYAKDVLKLYYCQLIELMGKNTVHDESEIANGACKKLHFLKEEDEADINSKRDSSGESEEVNEEDGGEDSAQPDDDDDQSDDDGEDDDDYDDDDEDEEIYCSEDDYEERDAENDEENVKVYGYHPKNTGPDFRIYDKNGNSLNGVSSPHLKRRYSSD
ncbi:uncharacterized protein LODBEIA_P40770 [Lodderomyces beijingensis]|uniref:Cyclin-domain-containing protein n=1 Tax=Lodderomyces beijingensis TaxID=1775926 RepID=A0ABP0ZNX0_9ASCO